MAPIPSPSSTQEITNLLPHPSSLLSLLRRQGNVIVPTTYGNINSGPSPGTVVGIVLGSVGGFLLILWLIYTCANFGNNSNSSSTESVVVRNRRKSRSHGSRRASETVEVRRERTPVRQPVERVVVEERTTRRERSRSRGSDEVVVIEEHSPPRRSKSKREREDRERRESGYRTVDPLAYGGVVGGGRKGGRR